MSDEVTIVPLGQERHDLARAVAAVKQALYEHGEGRISVAEAVGVLEMAKYEVLQEN